jgi:hypothetical protein
LATSLENSFEFEDRVYRQHQDLWAKEGKSCSYVVISGEEVLGFWRNAEEAFDAGLEKYGRGNFFMTYVLPSDSYDSHGKVS